MNGCCLCFELPDSNPECNYLPGCFDKIPNKSKLRKAYLDSRFKEAQSVWKARPWPASVVAAARMQNEVNSGAPLTPFSL